MMLATRDVYKFVDVASNKLQIPLKKRRCNRRAWGRGNRGRKQELETQLDYPFKRTNAWPVSLLTHDAAVLIGGVSSLAEKRQNPEGGS